MWRLLRRTTLTQWILVALIVGTLVGWAAPALATTLRPLSTVFLRMIKSIIVPLVFGSLVVGIAGHGDDLKRVGRLAIKALLYFEVVTTAALAVGLFAVNVVRPGVGVRLPAAAAPVVADGQPTFASVLEHVVPQSVVAAAAENEVLQIVFWAVLFGLALSQVRGRPREVMVGFCEALAEVMFKVTAIVMRYAPIGIGAAVAITVAQGGLGVLANLGKVVLTLYGALALFGAAVLLPVAWVARVPLRRFLRAIKEPALIAFTTTSSEAALPIAMEHMEAIGVPRRIVAFVMPTGYSFNLDGSTLYLAVASIFVAQAAGVALSLGQQLLLMFTLMVTSKGVAGVPRASLVILSGTLASFHLPLEAIAVLLGVDVVMDAARTTVNLVGNCLAAVVMARWEGEYPVNAAAIERSAEAA
jgi:proton glutamate symport protein